MKQTIFLLLILVLFLAGCEASKKVYESGNQISNDVVETGKDLYEWKEEQTATNKLKPLVDACKTERGYNSTCIAQIYVTHEDPKMEGRDLCSWVYRNSQGVIRQYNVGNCYSKVGIATGNEKYCEMAGTYESPPIWGIRYVKDSIPGKCYSALGISKPEWGWD